MDMWERYNNDSKIIDDYYEKINGDNYFDMLNQLYGYIKSIAQKYYKNGKMLRQYDFLKTELFLCEKKIRNISLINVPVKYNELEKENYIEYIVFKTRELILKDKSQNAVLRENKVNFENINLSNKCHRASMFIKKLCEKLNLKSYLLPIYPGYDKSSMLYDGNGYHFANVIIYNNKYYLVDTTYSQFFYEVKNNLNRLGIVSTKGCNPGVFMLMTEKGRNIANTIISNGYIELNEEIFKTYLDAFTISYRNGLFYDYTFDFSYSTNYSVDDYIKFLRGEDSQLNYEDRLYLGYQSKPLKNYQLSFKKR